MDDGSLPLEIPVWVHGTQKWVTGLTKRTTCDDVIYALLYQDDRHDLEKTHSYAIFERWRDVEKQLQSRTKIVKIWKEWGPEQSNVQLTMKRIDELEYLRDFARSRRRYKKSRHKTRERDRERERQVRRRSNRPDRSGDTSERLRSMESVVKLVISQEKKLQDLIERIRQTDSMIENYETRLHFHRIQQNGQDYVQNAYLDSLSEDSMDEFFSNVNVENMELYLQFCDKVINLEENLHDQHTRIEDLSLQIQDSFMADKSATSENLHDSLISGDSLNCTLEEEITQLHVELSRLVSNSMIQQYRADEISQEINFYDRQLRKKQELVKQLQYEMEAVELSESSCSDYNSSVECYNEPVRVLSDKQTAYSATIANTAPLQEEYLRCIHALEHSEPYPYTNTCPVDIDHMPAVKVLSTEPLQQTGQLPKNGYPSYSDTDTIGVSDDGHSNLVRTSVSHAYMTGNRFNASNRRRISSGYSSDQPRSDVFADRVIGDTGHLRPLRRYVTNEVRVKMQKVDDNDSNSDTGLSSMHSDESPTYLETLV